MPSIRPFRALRYSRDVVDDLSRVVAPPYDVVDERQRRELAARDPHNVVRLDLPVDEAGDPPDERYRRAARLLAAWRSDGTLRRDPRPSLYAYEQTYLVPGSDREAVRRGVFARVDLEPFGPGSGIRPHERTLSGPKEDRYRLLRATGVNTSPVVGMYEDASGRVPGWLRGVAATPPAIDLRDGDGVRHRLWVAPLGADEAQDSILRSVCEAMSSGPITLADGHHRYETALRYAEERRRGPVLEDDPAWAQILMLLLEPEEGGLTVLATHRVVVGMDDTAVDALLADLGALFDVERGVGADALVHEFGAPPASPASPGRFGLWTRRGGFLLRARADAFAPLLPSGGPALRRLDVTLAAVALERLAGLDAATVAGGGIAYTRSASEAVGWVTAAAAAPAGDGVASVALLLHPTPAAEIAAVAADGDVMPQKSTYIYPKALTGLVINPLE